MRLAKGVVENLLRSMRTSPRVGTQKPPEETTQGQVLLDWLDMEKAMEEAKKLILDEHDACACPREPAGSRCLHCKINELLG